ncbi:MAG: sigma 54-interacting transcriptional regulator, partial [Phycisphaerales bacterium]
QAVYEEPDDDISVERIIGQSPAMREVYKLIGRIAPRDVNVLITGESGTGKELIARAILHHSPRKDRPFLAISCAAIPET